MDGCFYIDEPRSGAMNMAVDQRMLELADQNRCAMLRVYQWDVPTLSLGYFQPIAQRQTHLESVGIACVRRSTGGGAIVHHHDWTYAVALPCEPTKIGASTELYDCVHDSLIAWLRQLGWNATKYIPFAERDEQYVPFAERDVGADIERSSLSSRTTSNCSPKPSCSDFLCFNRRGQGDIVVGGVKVLGSAQRRFGRTILQHGSLLLRTSPFAPSLPGLLEIGAGSAFPSSERLGLENRDESRFAHAIADLGGQLSARITEGIAGRFDVNFAELDRTSSLGVKLAETCPGTFAEDSWTEKR